MDFIAWLTELRIMMRLSSAGSVSAWQTSRAGRGRVQAFLHPSHRLPIAKLWCDLTSTRRSLLRANGARLATMRLLTQAPSAQLSLFDELFFLADRLQRAAHIASNLT